MRLAYTLSPVTPDHPEEKTTRGSAVNVTCENAAHSCPVIWTVSYPKSRPHRCGRISSIVVGVVRWPRTERSSSAGSRWPQRASSAITVPSGFAARVARRAFAGDPGSISAARIDAHDLDSIAPARPSQLPFLLKLCAIAAGLLFVFAMGIRERSLPAGQGLEAQDYRPPWEKELEPAPPERFPAGADAARDRRARERRRGTGPGARQVRGPRLMQSERLWIVLLAVVCFLTGLAGGLLAYERIDPRPIVGGPFADYQTLLVDSFELSPDQVRDLRFVPRPLSPGHRGASSSPHWRTRTRAR